LSVLQSCLYTSLYFNNNKNYFNKHITHHHYLLGGFCPRKTTQYTLSFIKKLALINVLDGITRLLRFITYKK